MAQLYVELFCLTPSEARLARALDAGDEPKTVAVH